MRKIEIVNYKSAPCPHASKHLLDVTTTKFTPSHYGPFKKLWQLDRKRAKHKSRVCTCSLLRPTLSHWVGFIQCSWYRWPRTASWQRGRRLQRPQRLPLVVGLTLTGGSFSLFTWQRAEGRQSHHSVGWTQFILVCLSLSSTHSHQLSQLAPTTTTTTTTTTTITLYDYYENSLLASAVIILGRTSKSQCDSLVK